MRKKVSIIVPVYNAGTYLAPCIDSLAAQTLEDLEIILVDDGSTDGSGAYCDRRAGEDERNRIRVVHKPNGGLISAWKCGISHADGQYFMFVDSDDWIDADFAERLFQETTGRPDEIISAGYVIERESGKGENVSSAASPGVYEGEKLHDLQQEMIGHEQRKVILSRCMKLVSGELFLQHLGYTDESIRMGEDVTVMLPCLLSCGRLVLLDGVFGYHYRFVEASMVHAYNPGLYENVKKLRDILERIAEDFSLEDGKEKAEREFWYLMCLELRNQLRRAGEEREIADTIRKEILAENMKEILEHAPEKPKDPANRLLAFLVRHPSRPVIRIMRQIFRNR